MADGGKDPRRSYPRALFGALATAGVVYVLVGIAAAAAVPTGELAESSGPLLEVVKAAGGVPTWLFSAIALVAVADGALLTGVMSSRLAYGMARDGLLPAGLTNVLPGRPTPWVAIAVTTALSILLALTGSAATLAFPHWFFCCSWCSSSSTSPFSCCGARRCMHRHERAELHYRHMTSAGPWRYAVSCR
ncbi:APC family permease [Streptomyces sp. CA-251247]|uniref:APC family permease n=1 Tax=Streptomyces sp. CA-251247 TaxID=3240062 RepID=UPI003D8BED79